MPDEGPQISDTVESTHEFYNENYANIQRIREQNGRVSDIVRAKNEVDLVYDAVGDQLKSGDSVLDCPCGLGFQADELAKRGLKVTAIDGSRDNIDSAAKREHCGNVNFKQGLFKDIARLVDKESQNVVCCFNESFGYEPTVEDNVAHMQSMFDVLKQGGKLVLTWDCTPSFYKSGRTKTVAREEGAKRWGTNDKGEKIGVYSIAEPPSLPDQVVPDKYIPEIGFTQLKGNSPKAIESRTVRSYGRDRSVFIDPNGNEHPAPSFEYREYLKPVFENASSGVNAPLGDTGEFYDIPLVRALCEHVGFENVKCVPAQKLSGETWTVGIVATKPSLKNLDRQITSTRGRVGYVLEQ